ncbi:response regulator [Desulfonauticus submarinus]
MDVKLKRKRMNVKLLLVDDEKNFLDAISKRLKKKGIEDFYCVYSGEECLYFLNKNKSIDVVVLDIKMPGIDGIETLKAIKTSYPLIEVILLTGHGTVESAIEGMKLGAYDYLMKPCELEDLIEKIEAAKKRKEEYEAKILEAKIKDKTAHLSWD